MASLSKVEIFQVEGMSISSVEKGNVGKVKDEEAFVAFSGRIPGVDKAVKLILKGKQAVTVYDTFLKDSGTLSGQVEFDGMRVNKVVTVSFTATLKEDRAREIALKDPTGLKFDYSLAVVD